MNIIEVLGNIFSFVFMLIAVGLILYLSYAVTKKLGSTGMAGGMSKNMRVVDRIFMGRDKSIVIVRVGEKDYLLGISQNAITLLKELPEGEILAFAEGEPEASPMAFLDTLKKKWKK